MYPRVRGNVCTLILTSVYKRIKLSGEASLFPGMGSWLQSELALEQ